MDIFLGDAFQGGQKQKLDIQNAATEIFSQHLPQKKRGGYSKCRTPFGVIPWSPQHSKNSLTNLYVMIDDSEYRAEVVEGDNLRWRA